ncbi:hypothetical protein WJS89_01570 [Sphingomicrobium sp. XHP0235]|uniref:hypothetical protein n=1 Tax=Sphingomicrobium aquimarinum TaxID=3133971 RepID=UPI0031FEE859
MSTLIVIGIFVIVLIALVGGLVLEYGNVTNRKGSSDERGAADARLKAENVALREQLDQVYDRLETLERIVTDKPSRLSEEIDRLATLPPRPPKAGQPPEPRREEKE